MVRPAPTGMVTTQEITISRTVFRFNASKPLARPTPNTAPTRVWVVEIGIPNLLASTMVTAAENSAAKPLLGVSSVMRLPCFNYPPAPCRQADDNANPAKAEHPDRHCRFHDHGAGFDDVDNGCKRADGVGNIIGTMGKSNETGA